MSIEFCNVDDVREMLMNSDFEEDLADVSSDEELDPDISLSDTQSNSMEALRMEEESEDDTGDWNEVDIKKSKGLLWSRDNLIPNIHNFDNSVSGVPGKISEDGSLFSFFELFFGKQMLHRISLETNNYYKYIIEIHPTTVKSRLTKWKDTDPNELYLFLATTILMSRVKKLKVSEYWSNDKLIETPIFNELFSRDRYLLLLRMLHFSDNLLITGDHLVKIRVVLDHLRAAFRKCFYPYQNLCIEESLILFKGQLSFKQYVPPKKSRFRVKLFVLCDCKTGFVLDFIVFTGVTSDIEDHGLGISGNAVATLLQPYLDKGHTIYLDNWYSSPALFMWLYNRCTNSCGTVRKYRKHMPEMAKKLKKGEFSFRSTEGKLIAVKWQDKKEVWMLSTLHKAEMIETQKKNCKTGEKVSKPTVVSDYNKNMGIVDKTDTILGSASSIRKTLKWYKKLFFHLVDLGVYNAHILYQEVNKKKMPFAKFQLDLIREMTEKFHVPRTKTAGRKMANNAPLRLTGRHFPKKLPQSGSRQNLKNCHVCRKRCGTRKRTSYYCMDCDVALCIDNCFRDYHTHKII